MPKSSGRKDFIEEGEVKFALHARIVDEYIYDIH